MSNEVGRAAPSAASMAPRERRELLGLVLKRVSRAFYLSMAVLPTALREPIGLAYLLARAADTIADTRAVPPADRLRLLEIFRAQIVDGSSTGALDEIAGAVGDGAEPAERALLASLPSAFRMLEGLPAADASEVRDIVTTLTTGMQMDLHTFPPEDSGRLGALPSAADLDRYTYYVAGCVGRFWTRVCAAHVPALGSWEVEQMSRTGIRFGKALQLVNVLRDVPRDLRMGRCYLPEDELGREGLAPTDLLRGEVAEQAWPVLRRWIGLALDHFDAAETYLLAIPRHCTRLRLSVAWPILIGLATLAALAGNRSWLHEGRPSRVRRAWVYKMLILSVPASFSNVCLRAWIGSWRRQVEATLAARDRVAPPAPRAQHPVQEGQGD